MILMRFIKMTVVKSDIFWISKAHNTHADRDSMLA